MLLPYYKVLPTFVIRKLRWLEPKHAFYCFQGELDRLRPLCYNKADVFILCFSVVLPSSFHTLMTKWLPEIRRHSFEKDVALLLVGTQSDLRSNTNVCKGIKWL